MEKKGRSLSKAALSLIAVLQVVVALGSGYLGVKLEVWHQKYASCCQLSLLRSIATYAKEILGFAKFYSQIGQDKWVSEAVFPGVRDGFFVDVGSGDGTKDSNTKALEEKGWTGICIDAFPRHMENRTCQVVKAVVFSEAGKRMKFLAAEDWGGIIDGPFGIPKDRVPGAPLVEFTTVTLGDILDRAKAPHFIHYMSMDIEGGELEALKGFPFDKYQIGALTVEHWFNEPKRTQTKEFLESHGYNRVKGTTRLGDIWIQDDYYMPANP